MKIAWFEDLGTTELWLCAFAALLLLHREILDGIRHPRIRILEWWG